VLAAPAGPMRADAAVNAANALTAWGERAGGGAGEGRQLVARAVELYRTALAQEEDALVRVWNISVYRHLSPSCPLPRPPSKQTKLWCHGFPPHAQTLSNLADALVQQGELAQAAGDAALAQSAFASALAAYEQSCGLSDSEAGDDLPSLLHNWGVGLHAVAKSAQVGLAFGPADSARMQHMRSIPVTRNTAPQNAPAPNPSRQDPAARRALLEQAAARLRHALQFSRGDAAPANALGDVLMDAAELLAGGLLSPSSAAAAPASASSAPASGQQQGGQQGDQQQVEVGPEQLQAAAAAARAAADEGYQGALTISRHNADALVGLAEANVALGRLAGAAAAAAGGGGGGGGTGDGAAGAAAAHFRQAVNYYGEFVIGGGG
jgi:hypothetical protein